MKISFLKSALLIGVLFVTISSCNTYNQSMREPNVRLELFKGDFTLSDQVTAEAKSMKILGVDWARLFTKKMGNIEGAGGAISMASIPVIGNMMTDKTSNYALWDMMQNNPGYDVVMYPQYETRVFKPAGIGFFCKITTVKATARLGKLNK